MTDKIFPTWINDRLPGEDDRDDEWEVYEYSKETNTVYLIGYLDVTQGNYWTNTKKIIQVSNWKDKTIATPQECLDRKQGNIEERMVMVEADFMQKRIKELEQALAKSEERVKEVEIDKKDLIEKVGRQMARGDKFGEENELLWKLIKIAKR